MAKERAKDVANNGKVDPLQLLDFIMKQGVPKNHALGMVANINTESMGFQHSIYGDNGNAVGLFQHNGPRKEALLKAIGGDLTDWEAQVTFALSEPDTKKYLAKQFDTPEAATKDFMVSWEIPKDQSSSAIAGRQDWLKDFGNGSFATPGYTQGSTSSYITPLNTNNISTPEHLRIVKLEEDVAAQKSDFNRRLEEEKQKEELAQKSKNVQELTKAEKDHNNRVAFLEAYSAPTPTDNTPTDPSIENIPSAMEQGLYTQNLGFDVQQGNSLFSTGQNPQMGDGGTLHSLLDSNKIQEFRQRYSQQGE